jgi:hypothetical protein
MTSFIIASFNDARLFSLSRAFSKTSCPFSTLMRDDPLGVARSSQIHEICGGEEADHEEHDEHEEHDTQIKGKHTHTQDTHRLSSLARFTNSKESQGRDSKSIIPCERLTCKG